jgi:hypothetical protein
LKAGVFKLNMHPKDLFDRNPFHEDGKGGKGHGEEKERSRSAPSDKKPFKYSSPGKSVCLFSQKKRISIPFILHSSVEIKMVVLINSQNVVKKIPMFLVRSILKLKTKLINKEKHIIQINFLKHVRRIQL